MQYKEYKLDNNDPATLHRKKERKV